MRLQALAILIVLSCAAPAAFAQSTAASSSDATTTAPAKQRQPLDANHDGVISREEAQSHPGLSRNFDKIDTNHDGQIDRQEFQAWRQQMQNRRSQKGQGQSSAEPQTTSPQSASSGG